MDKNDELYILAGMGQTINLVSKKAGIHYG